METESARTDIPSQPADSSRRSFIQGALATGAALGSIGAASLAHAQTGMKRSTINHYHIPVSAETVHWGYFSKSLKPLAEVESGDFVTIETLTHREVIAIYEVDASGERDWAKALYNFRWTPQTDPFGVVHKIIGYPSVPVDHSTVKENWGVLKNVRVPIRPHFGVLSLAPRPVCAALMGTTPLSLDSLPARYKVAGWGEGWGAPLRSFEVFLDLPPRPQASSARYEPKRPLQCRRLAGRILSLLRPVTRGVA